VLAWVSEFSKLFDLTGILQAKLLIAAAVTNPVLAAYADTERTLQ